MRRTHNTKIKKIYQWRRWVYLIYMKKILACYSPGRVSITLTTTITTWYTYLMIRWPEVKVKNYSQVFFKHLNRWVVVSVIFADLLLATLDVTYKSRVSSRSYNHKVCSICTMVILFVCLLAIWAKVVEIRPLDTLLSSFDLFHFNKTATLAKWN